MFAHATSYHVQPSFVPCTTCSACRRRAWYAALARDSDQLEQYMARVDRPPKPFEDLRRVSTTPSPPPLPSPLKTLRTLRLRSSPTVHMCLKALAAVAPVHPKVESSCLHPRCSRSAYAANLEVMTACSSCSLCVCCQCCCALNDGHGDYDYNHSPGALYHTQADGHRTGWRRKTDKANMAHVADFRD